MESQSASAITSWLDNGVQRLRKLFGLSHHVVNRPDNRAVRTPAVRELNVASKSSLPISGLNRSYVRDYVSNAFNQYCTEAGLQCTIGMNLQDLGHLIYMQNVGDKLVRVRFNGDTHYLEPKDKVTLKYHHGMEVVESLPEITVLNGGL